MDVIFQDNHGRISWNEAGMMIYSGYRRIMGSEIFKRRICSKSDPDPPRTQMLRQD
jgi:hypothetical protein